jgi:type II secretory pathway pseudopilin PulG
MIVIAIIAIIAAIAIPNLLAAKLSSNETSAIATIRSIVSAQAQVCVAGKIDTDNDGRGEYATFLELTGSVGVRRGYSSGPPASADFSAKGPALNPPSLSSVMGRIDGTGFATKAGYGYMIFLPDTADPASFVHEAGPAASASFAGGTGTVGVDLSEAYWCCYAQPVSYANSGNRRFFASQRGDIMQSMNDVAKANGITTPVAGNSAFLGAGITSEPAVGTVGQDGDVWKVTN